MIDFSNAFTPQCESVYDFFQKPGVGFYIPLYQRDYSWDDENIDQLMEDICRGVETLLEDDNAIHFLGTVILVKEGNPKANIEPKDIRALPTSIYNVIDGQQRLSTMALLACLLYSRFHQLEQKLTENKKIFYGLHETTNELKETLKEIFSVDIRRGRPTRKPIIIRGSKDCWTFDGRDDDNYISDVSAHLAQFITCIENENTKIEYVEIDRKTPLVTTNLKAMEGWLNKVENAYKLSDDEFVTAKRILEKIDEAYIWNYDRPELKEYIDMIDETNISKEQGIVCAIVQLLAFTHYLLKRCCFTTIEPTSDNWAFDMFQSLNASGTPLTSIETFKPIVVNSINSNGGKCKGSETENDFKCIDDLLGKQRTAATKSRLTNEFLTAFALVREGYKLSSQFSLQRRWLQEQFTKCSSKKEKQAFIQQMSTHALYYINILDHKSNAGIYKGFVGLPTDEYHEIEMLIRYLKDANHKMANALLSRFYADVLSKKENAENTFCGVARAIVAFFTLWRSADSNSGLDNMYRILLRGDSSSAVPAFSWAGEGNAATLYNLKKNFRQILNNRGYSNKDTWLKKARLALRYDKAKIICRFALFVAAHDTISDEDSHGLIKIGKEKVNTMLDIDSWLSDDYSDIEHIAPEKPRENSPWDTKLYEDDRFQTIGNLTLLPQAINSSASNKGWKEKYYYYLHLAERDPAHIAELAQKAKEDNIDLSKDVIEALRNAKHNHHIMPLVKVNADNGWNSDLVDARTSRICNILWDRIIGWLE